MTTPLLEDPFRVDEPAPVGDGAEVSSPSPVRGLGVEASWRTRRIRKTLAVLPSLMTLGNLVCGMASLFYTLHATAMNDPGRNFEPLPALQVAAWLIVAGMLFDVLDGLVARMTRTASEFGAELDSLCDMVTFGVAPAALVYRIAPFFDTRFPLLKPDIATIPGRLLWAVAIIYAVCVCLRLARFNVDTALEEESHRVFTGLPSPAAAGVVASLVLVYFDYEKQDILRRLFTADKRGYDSWMAIVLPVVTLVVAVLMVSRIRYPHVASWVLHGKKPPAFLLMIILFTMVVAVFPHEVLAAAFCLFALLGPLHFLYRLIWRPKDDPLTPEEEAVF